MQHSAAWISAVFNYQPWLGVFAMKKMVVLIFIMLFAFSMTVNATETENPTEVQQEIFDKFDFQAVTPFFCLLSQEGCLILISNCAFVRLYVGFYLLKRNIYR